MAELPAEIVMCLMSKGSPAHTSHRPRKAQEKIPDEKYFRATEPALFFTHLTSLSNRFGASVN